MGQWIWINSSVMPMGEARIDVQDRGFQFADGVYEVVRVYQGRCFTLAEHLDRLSKSAEAVGISLPISTSALAEQIRPYFDGLAGNALDRIAPAIDAGIDILDHKSRSGRIARSHLRKLRNH